MKFFSRFFLIFSSFIIGVWSFMSNKNNLETMLYNMSQNSAYMIPYCQMLINEKPFHFRLKRPIKQMNAMKNLCKTILIDVREFKEAKQREMEREIERKVYRTYLAPRISGSFATDFLTMRYRK